MTAVMLRLRSTQRKSRARDRCGQTVRDRGPQSRALGAQRRARSILAETNLTPKSRMGRKAADFLQELHESSEFWVVGMYSSRTGAVGCPGARRSRR